MKRFAKDTAVPISRSRDEVQKLLRQWEADAIRWTDDFAQDRVMLEFVWAHNGARYSARFALQLPNATMLRPSAVDGRTRRFSEAKMRKLMEARGKREHRTLLLFLKGAFEAVEEGIITAEQLFLPFLVGRDGRTVSEVLLPKITALLSGGAEEMLPGHKGEGDVP